MKDFTEWLLDEYYEGCEMRRQAVGPVKQSTLDLCDQAALEMRFRDSGSILKFEEWKKDK